MKIRLTTDLPVAKEHQMVAGLVLETIPRPKGKPEGVWVKSPSTGEPVRVWSQEYEEVA